MFLISPSTQWAPLLLAATVASAASICKPGVDQTAPEATLRREAVSYYHTCDTLYSTATYTCVALLCMAVLGGLVGYRMRQIEPKKPSRMRFAHVLIGLLYAFSIAFVFSAAMAKVGLGLATDRACRASIYLCFVFYILCKAIMYLFLIERAHALRTKFIHRFRDWLWLTGVFLVVSGFGGIGIVIFVHPVADISPVDGRCRIGIPRYITIPLLTYNICVDILLTLAFVNLISPLIRSGSIAGRPLPATRLAKCLSRICERSKTIRSGVFAADGGNRIVVEKLERLLWKTFLGSLLVLIPTIANLAGMAATGGRELGWICLTCCSLDVVWTVCVFHWLTIGASNTEEKTVSERTHRPSVAFSERPAAPKPRRQTYSSLSSLDGDDIWSTEVVDFVHDGPEQKPRH